jgi:methylglutaconyl-CoA hydratase
MGPDDSDTEPLLVERSADGVLRLTLNRPKVRNALSPALTARLTEEFSAIDKSVRLVVLTGAGAAFCAGGDLAALEEALNLGFSGALEDSIAFDRMFRAVDECPCPVIAAVDGPALGGGTGLAACADAVFATSRAVFGCPEVRVGIMPGVVGPYVIAKIGMGHARRLLLSGERIGAAEAATIGLVGAVVEPDDLEATVAAAVERYLLADPAAQRATKRLLRMLEPRLPVEVRSALTTQETTRVRVSEEGRRGLSAMLERLGRGRTA